MNLRQERVKVERRPANRPASEADLQASKDQSIELTETSEEPVVGKRSKVVEEVVVGKEVQQREEKVPDTVRRSDVRVVPSAVSRGRDSFSYGSDPG